ncbi:MAG: phage major capsid protein [Planctomycetota bacterium]
MLDSVKIARRQSEIRQELSTLAAKAEPSEDELRSMDTLDAEYRGNETRYRAALIAEDDERREAGAELETRAEGEWAGLCQSFEVRQAVAVLHEGRALSGQTAEVVEELRSAGAYQGVPVPWQALEQRNTVSSGTPDPIATMPIIDRLFPASVAARMGGQMVSIPAGEREYPVTTSAVAASWAASEGADLAAPTAYATTDKALAPDNTLGVRMTVTRKALKQSGAALEQAIRRDMQGAIEQAMDRAAFLGAGASGEPLGVIAGASTYGITETAVGAAATWGAFREAIVRFMVANAATGFGAVRVLMRPELYNSLDTLISGTSDSELDRMMRYVPAANMVASSNALAAPTGSPAASSALLTTAVSGVPPFFVATWGAVDLIRDVYSDAASGGLRLTALATMDVTVARGVQSEVLTGLE